jgi:hypothetical protein
MPRGWICPDIDDEDPNDPESRGVDPDWAWDAREQP